MKDTDNIDWKVLRLQATLSLGIEMAMRVGIIWMPFVILLVMAKGLVNLAARLNLSRFEWTVILLVLSALKLISSM